MKVFLLGLDGMTLRTVEPYVKANLLPNFKKIMEHGCYGVLRSTIPAITGPGWVSLASGKTPGKHGIYEFRKRRGYKVELITKCNSPHAEPMWSILSRHGGKVVIANVPFTYPPDQVNGIMISGLMTPGVNTDFVFPHQLKDDILKQIPDYQIDIDMESYLDSQDNIAALLNEVIRGTKQDRKLMNYLLDSAQWDLFFMALTGPDRVQHFLWDEIVSMNDECVRFYQLIDDILGDILERIDDETLLFVASDHGFGSAKRSFRINNFLRDIGLLQLRGVSQSKDVLGKMNISTAGLRRLAKKVGLSDVKKYVPESFLKYVRSFLPARGVLESEIDWRNTKACSLLMEGMIFINLKGREPAGIVEEDQYDELCARIKGELLALKDPDTGRNIVKAVFRNDELYSPQCDGDKPDLLLVANEGYSLSENLGGSILGDNRIVNKYKTGDHDENGMFLAYGHVIENMRINANIYDIMPTILYLMGAPVPEDVDGRVLSEAIRKDFVEKNKVRFEKTEETRTAEASTLKGKESEAIEKQLKNLGYLD